MLQVVGEEDSQRWEESVPGPKRGTKNKRQAVSIGCLFPRLPSRLVLSDESLGATAPGNSNTDARWTLGEGLADRRSPGSLMVQPRPNLYCDELQNGLWRPMSCWMASLGRVQDQAGT